MGGPEHFRPLFLSPLKQQKRGVPTHNITYSGKPELIPLHQGNALGFTQNSMVKPYRFTLD